MKRRQLMTGSAAAAVAAVVPIGDSGSPEIFSQQFVYDEIARVFGVPGELLGSPSIGRAWHDFEIDWMRQHLNFWTNDRLTNSNADPERSFPNPPLDFELILKKLAKIDEENL